MDQKPQIGTATIITRDNKVLLMKRKGPHGKGTWSTPGGHLDFGETLEGCAAGEPGEEAARETREEVGLDVFDIRFRTVTNDVFEDEGQHYITIWMDAKSTGEPYLAAEEEAEEIGWYAWGALPQPLFLPLENLV